MKLACCLLLYLLFTNGSYAQNVTDFSLRDYKYRTRGFRSGIIDLNSTGYINESGVPNSSGIFDGDSKGFQLNARSGFYETYSLDNRQHESLFTPRFVVSTSSNTVQGEKLPSNQFSFNADYSRTERFYKPKYFTELTGVAFLAGLQTKNKRVARPTEKRGNIFSSIGIGGGIGTGRLEFVEDAQMALFILEDLKNNKLLRADKVDKETANRFAEVITEIRNKRIQDFRRRRMYELAAIDSFLKAANLVNASDIRLFNVINDNWAFAVQSSNRQIVSTVSERQQAPFLLQGKRYNGFVRYVRAIAGYQYNSSKDELETSNTSTKKSSPSIQVSAGVEKRTPTSLKWQRDWNASINTSFIMDAINTNGVKSNNSYLAHFIDAGYEWGYFPNTRTSVSVGGSGTLYYSKPEKFSATVAAVASADYFLNYFTRITADVSLTARPIARSGVPKPALLNFRIVYTHVLY